MGHNATVYRLAKNDRYEVGLLYDIDDFFDNPLLFSTTGYVYCTPERTLQSNSNHSLGLMRPQQTQTCRGIYIPFCNMDL